MRLRTLCLLLIGMCCASAASQVTSEQTQLELGVLCYRAAQYEDAIQHFQKAAELDPTSTPVHLWLANAFTQTYTPGVDTPDNVRRGELAIEQYKKTIDLDPRNMDAFKGVAYLSLQMKNFNTAKDYYRRASEADPNDPEPYFSIAVIDWTQTYQARTKLRAKLGLKPEQGLIQRSECWQMQDSNKEQVEDGIQMLKRAIELRQDYDDAMAYMNLMYRERADIQCGDVKASEADLKIADNWVDVTLAVKKRKAEQENGRPKSGATTPESSTAPSPR